MTAARIALFGLIALALFGATSLSIIHVQSGETCPLIATVPACLIVLLGYVLILMSVGARKLRLLFWFGAGPVLVLALLGVGLETLRGGGVCPAGPLGIPQCFISLGIILVIIVLRWRSSPNPRSR